MSAYSQLDHAYAICRGITRSAAKNFYYAFIVMPREKRNALCAVYAFMRHCDDISDDPTLPLAERYARLTAWQQSFHQVVAGKPTDDPVLLAVAHAQRGFDIPLERFDQLMQGTAMDLEAACNPADPAGLMTFRSFDELSQYCYHVASVVGLITIRIFGYRDTKAEPLAERTGIAFQLTNIIRDVREDALLGRVYLPEEDLARFGRSAQELAPQRLANGFIPAAWRDVLQYETERARAYYRSADELIPLIDEDCQAALWTLVTIYRRLLDKIAQRDYNVFRERVRLTMPEKLAILGKGFLRRLA